ncbi:hypothetical protein ACN2EN_07630 [Aliarcobacter lanthieri]|uniref:hypothetical protein n=1 Tax=Aliarcobacter lanthieri TaxID=1355374 RepID=UPI003AFAEB5E
MNTLNRIVHELHLAKDINDYFDIWYTNEKFLTKNKSNILFTQKTYTNHELPNISIFSGYENEFKSLFDNNNLTFLNENIANASKSKITPKFRIDYSVSMDTQFISYIERYFCNKRFEDEIKFEEVLYKLIDNDVNLDYIPYLIENMSKGTPIDGIKQNLKEVIRFFCLDKNTSLIIRNMKISNEEDFLKKYNFIETSLDSNRGKQLYDYFNYFYRVMYLILLNIVYINKKENSFIKKIDKLLSFMHYDLSAIFARELIVASKFYELDDKIIFFRKVRDINKKTITKLKNMAWDLALIRFLEGSFSMRPNPNADFYIPYFITFDKGLSQIIDLFPLKTILSIKEIDLFQTIPHIEVVDFLEKYNLDEKYYSDEAKEYRKRNIEKSKKNYEYLISKMEQKFEEFY